MAKVRYETDPHNRLSIKGPGRFRTVVDGDFKVSEDNELSYHVKKSSGIDTPQEIKFSGKWSLGDGNRVIFTLDKWNNQVEGNKLVLRGQVLGADSSELVYSITTGNRIYLMKFSGKWQADKYNRLCFEAERGSGKSDILTLRGIWEINKNNEIIYVYKRRTLKTKEASQGTVTFKGCWDITDKDRLVYLLNSDLGSQFDFKVSFEKALKNGLRFSLGIGAQPKNKRFTLFGNWKFSRGLGLTFELASKNGRIQGLNLGAVYPFAKEQGEAFLKLLASRQEIAFNAGMGFRW